MKLYTLYVLMFFAFILGAEPVLKKQPVYLPYGENAIRDTLTGLIWTRCSAGQTRIGKLCSGSASDMTWHQAIKYCSSLGSGKVHWRLPTRLEIQTLVDEQRSRPPFIDLATFSIANRAEYWTTDRIIVETGVHFYYLNFMDGLIYSTFSTHPMYVWCVTGQQL